MPRRIDIELTSRRDDGTWTWRAPGARQPKGTLDGALLPGDAKLGDVLRADVEFELEGIEVVGVLAKRTDRHADSTPARIEVLGSGRGTAGVSVTLASPGRRSFDEDGPGRGPRRRDERAPADRRAQRERPAGRRTTEHDRRPEREGGPERPAARSVPVPRPPREGAGPRGRTPGGAERGRPGERPARPRGLQVSSQYRNAALAELRPEQLPVAEQLIRGGIPALRKAIEEQNERARSEGRAEVAAEPLLAMAEELLPRINLASWKDRAVSARNAGRECPLRELRSIVSAASTVILDDEGRELSTTLRQSLDARITALRQGWIDKLGTALDEQRVLDALRLAGRPPEPATRLPAELAVRLSDGAGRAMAPELDPPAWLELLEAVKASPVRRTVKPAGLPAAADEEVRATARRAAGYVPELARLLGLPVPPPPGPRRPPRPAVASGPRATTN